MLSTWAGHIGRKLCILLNDQSCSDRMSRFFISSRWYTLGPGSGHRRWRASDIIFLLHWNLIVLQWLWHLSLDATTCLRQSEWSDSSCSTARGKRWNVESCPSFTCMSNVSPFSMFNASKYKIFSESFYASLLFDALPFLMSSGTVKPRSWISKMHDDSKSAEPESAIYAQGWCGWWELMDWKSDIWLESTIAAKNPFWGKDPLSIGARSCKKL